MTQETAIKLFESKKCVQYGIAPAKNGIFLSLMLWMF
jgi:hypothetical protein